MALKSDVDILENSLRRQGKVLDILLKDRTTNNNIIWATDSYLLQKNNKAFSPDKPIKSELVTGTYGRLIQPRAVKSLDEQKRRTKERGEVFTPPTIVDKMNTLIDSSSNNYPVNDSNWQKYVKELRLEITCGEAPFIVSRYNPTAHSGKIRSLENRVGFLDKKLYFVSKYCTNEKDWLIWAEEAFKASYGYEWQGDNILLARENLLATFIDYYEKKFGKTPSLKIQEHIAKIISWNIIQMDGLKYVIPMSCHLEDIKTPEKITLFGEIHKEENIKECDGCRLNNPAKHNGTYVKIMDWERGEPIEFFSILKENIKYQL